MGHDDSCLTRRDALRLGIGMVTSAVLWRSGLAGFGQTKEKRKMLQIGIQSYCLRGLPWREAMAKAKALGVTAWEVFPGHIPPKLDETTDEAKKLHEQAGMAMPNYGVVGLGDDPEADRTYFEFAKRMGIRVLTADPNPDNIGRIGELADRFGVSVAIHNHGPGARYDKTTDVSRVLESASPRIGACVDTGHFIRSGEDPVAIIRTLGKRVLAVHLKDFADATTEKVLGEGKLDLAGVSRALKEVGFEGLVAVEYELDPKGETGALSSCLEAARKALA